MTGNIFKYYFSRPVCEVYTRALGPVYKIFFILSQEYSYSINKDAILSEEHLKIMKKSCLNEEFFTLFS